MLNVKSRIRRSAEGDFIIKCGFSLENVQPSPFENETSIVNLDIGLPKPIRLNPDYIMITSILI